MPPQIIDVDLENFHRIPRECRATLFWEMDHDDRAVNARFQKEEWFSSTLLEWGLCGKLLVGDGLDPGAMSAQPESRQEGHGFAEFAPATLFPRLQRFPAGEAASPADTVYLAYCYVTATRRGHGLGTALVREVARSAVDRGYRAVEALGDRAWDGGWVIPVTFLAANGFHVVRDDDRFPLLRLDLRGEREPLRRREESAVPALETPTTGSP
jgi:GNAT superfamily N-acetyltransferase